MNLDGVTVPNGVVRQLTGWNDMRIHRAIQSGELPRPVNEEEVRRGVPRAHLLTGILKVKERLG